MPHTPGQNVLFVHWRPRALPQGVRPPRRPPVPGWTSWPPKAPCSPGHTPPPRCARRRAVRSCAGARRATGSSGWRTTAGIPRQRADASPAALRIRLYTALFGMQHETSFPSRLGFDEYDVSNSYCEYVVEQALRWLGTTTEAVPAHHTGFFETHRPYPRERYEPAAGGAVTVPRLPA